MCKLRRESSGEQVRTLSEDDSTRASSSDPFQEWLLQLSRQRSFAQRMSIQGQMSSLSRCSQHLVAFRRRPTSSEETAHVGSAYHTNTTSQTIAVLGTAVVTCLDKDGKDVKARALVDTGSMLNMVTEAFAAKLKYTLSPSEAKINTVGDQDAQISKGTVNFNIRANDNNQIAVQATVLTAVTGKLPTARLDISKLAEIEGKRLADPKFHIPGDIDMILGVEMFHTIMLDDRVKVGRLYCRIHTSRLDDIRSR